MKCPKCNYISFDHNENCPKCKRDLTEVRMRLNFPDYCPLILTQGNLDGQISEGSIRIEQTGETGVEESMDMQFSDSEDFASSFDSSLDEALGESDLDFSLSDEADDDLSLDFDEFSLDEAGTEPSGSEMKTIAADSLEEELNLSFADDTDDITMNFEEAAAEDAGESTLDFDDLAMEGGDTDQSEAEMETIMADSLEDDLDMSFADDTGQMTADFEEVAAEEPGESTLDFDDLAMEGGDTDQSEAEMETIMADSLDDELDMSFADDTGQMTADFEEVVAEDPGESTLDFEDLAMEDVPSDGPEGDSLELTRKDVDKITLDFENSISADEESKNSEPLELDVLDLDLDLSNDNSS